MFVYVIIMSDKKKNNLDLGKEKLYLKKNTAVEWGEGMNYCSSRRGLLGRASFSNVSQKKPFSSERGVNKATKGLSFEEEDEQG